MSTSDEPQQQTAKRYDAEKVRLDLVPASSTLEMGKVFTFGAKKYGDHNWRKGMKWSRVVASLKRHLNAFELSQDYDPETNLLHMSHVLANAAMLVEYYETNMKGDDRPARWSRPLPRVGLDVDEVLAAFVDHYQDFFQVYLPVECFNFDPEMPARLAALRDNDEFWHTMPVKLTPQQIPFEPTCYISSRVCAPEVTKMWLQQNGFPVAPVFHVTAERTKAQIARECKLDYFVDDRYENFVEMHNAGVTCFLFDAPHNRRYDVQSYRISTLDLFKNIDL